MIKHTTNYFSLPYTPFVTIFGMAIGYFTSMTTYMRESEYKELSQEDQEEYLKSVEHSIGLQVSQAIENFKQPDPHMVILVFLPALIFESAFNADYYTFKRQFFKIFLLAGPVLLACTFSTAAVMLYGFRFDLAGFDFWSCCLFGAIISATDPVAVVALLKELGVSKRISTLIEGESLMNDGTAYVVFLILLEVVADDEYKADLTIGQVIG